MPTHRILVAVLALFAPSFAIVSFAQSPTKPHATDLHGDPLPKGAIARLGTVRWRAAGGVRSLTVSPNGKSLVTVSLAPSIELTEWETSTGIKRGVFTSRKVQYWGAAFSPDGKELFTASQDHDISVYSTAARTVIRRIKGHNGLIPVIALSANGKTLATCSSDQTIRVWDAATGNELWRLQIKDNAGRVSLALSPDGKQLLQVGYQCPPTLWDTSTGKKIWHCRERNYYESAAFSPDGSTVAIGSHGVVHLLDVASKKMAELNLATMWDVMRVDFSANGKLLACGKSDTIWLLDWPARKMRHVLQAQGDFLRTLSFTPDSKLMIAAGETGRIHRWNVASGRPDRPLVGHGAKVNSVMYSPDGHSVATVGADCTVRLWDATTGEQLNRLEVKPAKESLQVFSKNAKALTVFSTTDIWEHPTHRILAFRAHIPVRRCLVSQYPSSMLALSPDGKTIASHDKEIRIVVRDRSTGKKLHVLSGHQRQIRALAFSPDGTMLASGGVDGILCLWEVGSGKRLMQHKYEDMKVLGPGTYKVSVTAICFSPDNTRLAANVDNEIHLWDVAARKKLRKPTGNVGQNVRLVFSPDGRVIASNDGNRDLTIWETATLRTVKTIGRPNSFITSFDFSPDTRRIVTGHRDTTAVIWDLTNASQTKKWLANYHLDDIWRRLVQPDAANAWESIWRMVAAPKQSVAFLKNEMRPVKKVSSKQLAQWLADLDSRRFTVRQRATRELERAGDAARGVLEKALKKKSTLEFHRRVKLLVDKLRKSRLTLRHHRALAVLEYIGDSAACDLLESRAQGAPDASKTREARQILTRIRR